MRKWYPWAIIVAVAVFSLSVYHRLPERVATHWDVRGDVNGWDSRPFAAWMLPGVMVLIALLMPLLPRIDPRRVNFEKFRPTYDLIVNAIVTLLGVIHVSVLGAGLGWPILMERFTPLMIGGLLILLGNVLPRVRSNWWLGIRTPWTLSSERVWERTHRVGGYLLVGAGTVMILLALLPPPLAGFTVPIIVGIVIVTVAAPVIYSYFAWKQEKSQ